MAALIPALFYENHPEEGVKTLVGVSLSNLADPWQQQLYADLKTALAGQDAALLVYDAAGQPQGQQKNLREIQSRKADILIIVPIQDSILPDNLKAIQNRGIPVILMGTGVPGFEARVSVFCDNEKAGYLAGHYIGERLSGQGVLMEVSGDPEDPVSSARKKGFRRAVAEFPKLRRTYLVPGHNSGAFTETSVDDNHMNVTKPFPNAIFAHTDLMAIGAARAFESSGLNPIVVGINGLPGPGQGVELVQKGILDATITCPTGGAEAVSALTELRQGRDVPKKILLSSKLLVKP